MNRLFSIRTAGRRDLIFAAVLLCCGVPMAQAQTASPSTPATGQAAHSDLKVDYVGGKLSVNASNASLNQILHEIAGKTGMKLTGGVNEERVFGQYGPSPPSVVLASLLDGTGSNMLLVNSAKGPAELILTPRSGGPTPPNPNPQPPPPEEHAEEPPAEQPASPQAPPPALLQHRGIGHPPTPGSGQENGTPGTTDNPTSPNGGDTPASPNGTRTPQQIYNQLRQMQPQDQQNPQ
jgi:hypothetical protein